MRPNLMLAGALTLLAGPAFAQPVTAPTYPTPPPQAPAAPSAAAPAYPAAPAEAAPAEAAPATAELAHHHHRYYRHHYSYSHNGKIDAGPTTPDADKAYMNGGVILQGAPGAPAPKPQATPPGQVPANSVPP